MSEQNMVLSADAVDVASIHPSMGAKFSPNLHSYLTAPGNGSLLTRLKVYHHVDTGVLWLGYVYDCCFTGTRLGEVLTKGRKASVCSYPQLPVLLRPVEDFWTRYTAIGRCAIDSEHNSHFIGGETRWLAISATERKCSWCNATQVLRRWTETVEREAWGSRP